MAPWCPLDLICFASLSVEMWFPWGGGAVWSFTVLLLQPWSRSNFLRLPKASRVDLVNTALFLSRVIHAENRHVLSLKGYMSACEMKVLIFCWDVGLGSTHNIPHVVLEVAYVLGMWSWQEYIVKELLPMPMCMDLMVDVSALISICIFSCVRCRIWRIWIIQILETQ